MKHIKGLLGVGVIATLMMGYYKIIERLYDPIVELESSDYLIVALGGIFIISLLSGEKKC